MNIVIKESQLSFLLEIAQQKLFDISEVGTNKIFKRCAASKLKKIYNSPWCQLSMMFKTELDEDLQNRLLNAVNKLLNVYKKNYDTGIVSKIIELSLQDRSRTVTDLELVTDFLYDEKFSKDQVKKELLSLRNLNKIPTKEELESLLTKIRNKAYVEYENSFEGSQFDIKRTFLQLDYRCDPDMDMKFFDLIQKIRVEKKDVTEFVRKFTKCIELSMNSNPEPIKSDLFLKTDLYVVENNDKKVVLPRGNYEVKKIDPLVDSYLSEFFSIFKESSLKSKKEEYLDLYNQIIQVIFLWIKENGKEYLENVKKGMNGIIFSDNIIIPIKYIDLYWSNKGQRGCKEKRLSIRYKLSPEADTKNIEAYKYTHGSDIVERIENFNLKLQGLSFKEDICN